MKNTLHDFLPPIKRWERNENVSFKKVEVVMGVVYNVVIADKRRRWHKAKLLRYYGKGMISLK
jgi:hypothetical protein